MKHAFLVGGAGFVGSNLVRRLWEMGEVRTITVFDNESSGSFKSLPPGDRVYPVEGNARDFDYLRVAMNGHDTVIHLAANPDIARAAKEPAIDFEQGTVLTQNVLEAMRMNGIKNLIYLSGSGVYGDRFDEHITEDTAGAPISTYGASKLASEAMISAYCAMFGLQAGVFRPANIVGPGQTHGVGYDFLRKLRADPKSLSILGDGQQTKSYIHVSDVIAAILMKIRSLEAGHDPAYEVFNIASADAISVLDIAHAAVEVMGLTHVALLPAGGKRGWLGDVPVVYLDCARLKARGWAPKLNSHEAMRHALVAMRDQLP